MRLTKRDLPLRQKVRFAGEAAGAAVRPVYHDRIGRRRFERRSRIEMVHDADLEGTAIRGPAGSESLRPGPPRMRSRGE